jgi:hypothetical protein
MKIIKKINEIYHYRDNQLYCSLFGPLLMGTIHLISTIIHFDWIVINYCIFFYLMVLFKVFQWAIEKYNLRFNIILVGIISIVIILAPMMASFILTIMFKDSPHYIFEWIIYAYATYATIKMVFAVRNLLKKEKTNREYVNSYLGLLSALYTIQMLEFNLIMFASNENVDNSMYLMQLFSQGAIFIFSIFVIIKFIKKYR